MTTRNRRKLEALNKENCEDHPGSKLAKNSSAPRSQKTIYLKNNYLGADNSSQILIELIRFTHSFDRH